MKKPEDEKYYAYMLVILKAMSLEPELFFEYVGEGRAYEAQINNWIKELYDKGKTTDEAIRFIYSSLRQIMIDRNY